MSQDFFYEIAMTRHPIGISDKEVEPRPTPEIHFRPETGSTIEFPVEKTDFATQCQNFKQELARLKEQYLPFMQNFLPKLPMTVKKQKFKEFTFRYLEPGEVFSERNAAGKAWKQVTIPDYRGPAGSQGKWRGYYRRTFSTADSREQLKRSGQRAVLCFQCIDYIAEIYVNGNYMGGHEGFFAPFTLDVTDALQAENELVILCKNDIPTLGTSPVLDGDKIYAATGPGWDDPQLGWHHCPAGAGVFGQVCLEIRPEIFIEDIFVRPDIDHDGAELRIGIVNYTDQVQENYQLEIMLTPKNYQGAAIGEHTARIFYIGPGKNEYRYYLPLADYRLWYPQTPWLYGALVTLSQQMTPVSTAVSTFGLKKFVSVETTTPKGKFFLNNEPIVLRGANEMGHLQQCVMKGDFDQLIEDILIAKLCHMNYYRVTQRPVQEEIYDYFDMLGMLHQCDLPLFAFLRRPQFAEAIRQTIEMEHLVRRHVSTVMVTFINEPMCIRRTEDPEDKFSKRYRAKGHRHLLRDELEAFFAAARKAIYTENPDRVIKNVEGDYDGPTAEGMPDFHCYTMWYTNHGEPIGRLMRGYLPPVKEGFMIGCGEYGAEGLDNEDLIRERYPREWLRTDEQGYWYPDKIVRAQTHSVQGDWYEEQNQLSDWVRESQLHQARATRLMTDAFRRRGDVIHHTAIHLLIDAWPSGWMKTLVGCDRMPKRAYFAYQQALIPLRINLYTGRSCVYGDETIEVEAWMLNDTGQTHNLSIRARLRRPGSHEVLAGFALESVIDAADARCAGRVPVTFPQKIIKALGSQTVLLEAAIYEEERLIYSEAVEFQVYSRKRAKVNVIPLGAEAVQVAQVLTGPDREGADSCMLVSDLAKESLCRLEAWCQNGGSAVLLLPQEAAEIQLAGELIRTKGCGELFFAAAENKYKNNPLGMLYNQEKAYIDATAAWTIDTALAGETWIYTYDKSGFNGSYGAKPHLPLVKCCPLGKGRLTLVSLARSGRLGYNPGLDRLLQACLGAPEHI